MDLECSLLMISPREIMRQLTNKLGWASVFNRHDGDWLECRTYPFETGIRSDLRATRLAGVHPRIQLSRSLAALVDSDC